MENPKKIIIEKLLKSHSLHSLMLETQVYNLLKEKGWSTSHSPYYLDKDTNKFRELDIRATKYWNGDVDKYSCRIEVLIECKSIKDYHIVVSNKNNYKSNYFLKDFWIGNDSIYHYKELYKILKKNNIKKKFIPNIIKKIDKYCIPEATYRNVDYLFDAFDIPSYNTFRETNSTNEKTLDNSVIWKSYQSLNNCFNWYDNFVLSGIDYDIKTILNNSEIKTKDISSEIVNNIIETANHKIVVQPVIVVESNLWELYENELKELKFFRLCFQQLYQDESWVDIVNVEYIEEYFDLYKKYDQFLIEKSLKSNHG